MRSAGPEACGEKKDLPERQVLQTCSFSLGDASADQKLSQHDQGIDHIKGLPIILHQDQLYHKIHQYPAVPVFIMCNLRFQQVLQGPDPFELLIRLCQVPISGIPFKRVRVIIGIFGQDPPLHIHEAPKRCEDGDLCRVIPGKLPDQFPAVLSGQQSSSRSTGKHYGSCRQYFHPFSLVSSCHSLLRYLSNNVCCRKSLTVFFQQKPADRLKDDFKTMHAFRPVHPFVI